MKKELNPYIRMAQGLPIVYRVSSDWDWLWALPQWIIAGLIVLVGLALTGGGIWGIGAVFADLISYSNGSLASIITYASLPGYLDYQYLAIFAGIVCAGLGILYGMGEVIFNWHAEEDMAELAAGNSRFSDAWMARLQADADANYWHYHRSEAPIWCRCGERKMVKEPGWYTCDQCGSNVYANEQAFQQNMDTIPADFTPPETSYCQGSARPKIQPERKSSTLVGDIRYSEAYGVLCQCGRCGEPFSPMRAGDSLCPACKQAEWEYVKLVATKG